MCLRCPLRLRDPVQLPRLPLHSPSAHPNMTEPAILPLGQLLAAGGEGASPPPPLSGGPSWGDQDQSVVVADPLRCAGTLASPKPCPSLTRKANSSSSLVCASCPHTLCTPCTGYPCLCTHDVRAPAGMFFFPAWPSASGRSTRAVPEPYTVAPLVRQALLHPTGILACSRTGSFPPAPQGSSALAGAFLPRSRALLCSLPFGSLTAACCSASPVLSSAGRLDSGPTPSLPSLPTRAASGLPAFSWPAVG
jgi:hypothetical protein